MRKINLSGGSVYAVILLSAYLLSSCASTSGIQRSDDFQESMQNIDTNISEIVRQIDAIETSLEELTRPGQGDVRAVYDRFAEQVSELENMENDFESNLNDMHSRSETYFEQWANDEEFENPDLRRRSESRRNELTNRYNSVQQHSEGLSGELSTFVRDVGEIEAYLANDLTSDGISAVTDVAEEVINHGEQLKNDLRNLQAAVENTRMEMRPSGIARF